MRNSAPLFHPLTFFLCMHHRGWQIQSERYRDPSKKGSKLDRSPSWFFSFPLIQSLVPFNVIPGRCGKTLATLCGTCASYSIPTGVFPTCPETLVVNYDRTRGMNKWWTCTYTFLSSLFLCFISCPLLSSYLSLIQLHR